MDADCEKMQGEWDKFVSNNRTGVPTMELEASAKSKLAEKYGVQGYPTLLMVDANGVLANFEEPERNAEVLRLLPPITKHNTYPNTYII